MLEIVPCSMQTNSGHIRSLLRFISHKKNIWYEVRDKQKEQGSTAEQTWGLRFLSAPALARAQKSMSAYVLTSRAHGSPARFPSGFPRSPHSPNHSHAHCPLCCCVFTVCLKNSPLSSSPLYIKSELSLAVPSKTSATNTHSEYISPSGSNPQMLSKNKIVDVTDMRSFTKLIPGSFRASQTPATLHDCYSGEGPRATRFCSLYYMCCQANCLPCTLWFWTGVQLWSSLLQPLSRNTHPAKLKLTTTSHRAAHRSTYAPV